MVTLMITLRPLFFENDVQLISRLCARGRRPGVLEKPKTEHLVFHLTVAGTRRCAHPLERIRVLEDSRAGAMWVRRALQRAEPGAP